MGAADENAQEGAQLDYQFYKRKKYGRETNIRLQLFILTRKVKNQTKQQQQNEQNLQMLAV